jgi:hypothetical protein
MAKLTVLLAISVFALSGCPKPTAATSLAVPGVLPIPEGAVGQHCVVHLKTPPNSSTQYEGTVTAVDHDKVVMSNPVVYGRTDNSVPVLGRLPWVGRYFRSVGIGREVMNGEVEIRRTEIRSIDVSSGTTITPNHAVSGSRR